MPQETAIEAAPTRKKIEAIEAKVLQMEQVPCPLTHIFSPGIYWREIFMPKGAFIIGHEHKTEHINVVLAGKASVLCDGKIMDIEAPMVFTSKAGVRKMLLIIEDMRFATVHATDETDIEKMVDLLAVKSGAFLEHEAAMKQLLEHQK